jgi:hypothetical protein
MFMQPIIWILIGAYVGISVLIGIVIGNIEGFWAGIMTGFLWPIGLAISIYKAITKGKNDN